MSQHVTGEGRTSGRIPPQWKHGNQQALDFEQFLDDDVAKFAGMETDLTLFKGDAGASTIKYRKGIKERDEFAELQYEQDIQELHKKRLPPPRAAPAITVRKELWRPKV